MNYDPEKHHRRSIRLRGYDYTQAGANFVTICAQDRMCLFGEIVDGVMVPNEAGLMVESWWGNVTRRFPGVDIDTFVVMPNHFHGIVWLGTVDPSMKSPQPAVGAGRCACPPNKNGGLTMREPSLSDVVGWFKSTTTKDYILGVNSYDWPPFRKRLWQRNYHEQIVRTDRALDQIRQYIDGNPSKWSDDPEHPEKHPS